MNQRKIKNRLRNLINKHLRLSACIVLAIVIFVGVALTYYFMPLLLNYGPGTINTSFDKEISGGLTYFSQFCLVYIAITLIGILFILKHTKELKNVYKLRDEAFVNAKSKEKLDALSKKCITLPQKLFFIISLAPSLTLSWVFIFLGFTSVADAKVILVITIISLLGASLTYIFLKSIFKSVLSVIGNTTMPTKTRFSLTTSSTIQIASLVLICVIYTLLLMQATNMEDKAEILRKHYISQIENTIKNTAPTNLEELHSSLYNIEFISPSDSAFILDADNQPLYNNDSISSFFIKYAQELAENNNNAIYDYYGTEAQGVLIPVTINDEIYKVVVHFDLSNKLLAGTLINLVIIVVYCGVSIYFFSTSISKEISMVAENLRAISQNSKNILNTKLCITSNDELGELVDAFNDIQTLTTEHVEQIETNQEILLEKERLASLGQMIGGIAHNLKTPIMSIAGAAEGITELISEYVASISNPSVTTEDHKEIAKDMLEWVTKIKTHTSYMSDIITAVKGQAAQLTVSELSTFPIYDLIKKSDILVKHELKNSLVTLDVQFNCDPSIVLHGDINSLIQVLVNIISNACQSYNGLPNKTVTLTIDADKKNVYIYIIDHGCGMSEEVKAKLFKEMITTKGKNGTGIGLYMSYSTIKGNFGGDIEFDSKENFGTTFKITLPIK